MPKRAYIEVSAAYQTFSKGTRKMKKSTKITLTAILLITVFTAHTSVCRAEYSYWFWDNLNEPLGLISDVGAGACHSIGGLWKFIFGESKRESEQADVQSDPAVR